MFQPVAKINTIKAMLYTSAIIKCLTINRNTTKNNTMKSIFVILVALALSSCEAFHLAPYPPSEPVAPVLQPVEIHSAPYPAAQPVVPAAVYGVPEVPAVPVVHSVPAEPVVQTVVVPTPVQTSEIHTSFEGAAVVVPAVSEPISSFAYDYTVPHVPSVPQVPVAVSQVSFPEVPASSIHPLPGFFNGVLNTSPFYHSQISAYGYGVPNFYGAQYCLPDGSFPYGYSAYSPFYGYQSAHPVFSTIQHDIPVASVQLVQGGVVAVPEEHSEVPEVVVNEVKEELPKPAVVSYGYNYLIPQVSDKVVVPEIPKLVVPHPTYGVPLNL